MTREEKEDQAQLEWLRKWKERRKEKRDVRKKSLFYKILRKLGIIKDYEEDIRTRMEMCERAIKANVCPEDCDICAWDVRKGLTLGEAIKYADTYNVSIDYIAGRKKVEY